MKYNLAVPSEIEKARSLLGQLILDKKMVEVKEVKPKRSLSQNSYLHLLLGAFGSHFGYSLSESKEIYKRFPGNKEVFLYTKDVGGKPMQFTRSSADLDIEEMTKSIDILRDWSAKLGYPLPTATDREWLMQLENDIESNGRYL